MEGFRRLFDKIRLKLHLWLKQFKSVENVFLRILLSIIVIVLTIGIFYLLSIVLLFLVAFGVSVFLVSYVVLKIRNRIKGNRDMYNGSGCKSFHDSRHNTKTSSVRYVKVIKSDRE